MKIQSIVVAIIALLVLTAEAIAQSTAFTYHGRLSQNGVVANGNHDMQFTVYASQAGNDVVAGPLPRNDVPVNNGLFTLRLDFGGGVFTGAERWLEVRVRRSGNGEFETLTPRHELTSSPYAIRALTAASAEDVANGSVVKSLNNLRDHVSLVAGANVTLTPNGNALTIASAGVGGNGIWSVNNNNTFYTAGRVGIGTSQPEGLLDVASGGAADTSALFVRADPEAFGRGGIIHHQSATYGWQELAQNTGSPTDGLLTFHYVDRLAPSTKVASTVLTLRGNGSVGIGTEAPQTKLTVFTPTLSYGVEHTDGTARLSTFIGRGSGWLGTLSNHKLTFFANDNGFPHMTMTLDVTGNVGIGTDNPTAKLDVAGDVKGTRLILRADPLASANAAVLCEDPNVVNFVPYNTAIGRPMNVIARDATVRQLTITGGADLAEPFKMSSEEISKGSVVVIDEHNPGHLKLSNKAYDTRVAGIVSGANGIKPGISLHQEGAVEGGENVALSGRVYVRADATAGAIRPGDLLTTSDTPGHAMKVANHVRAQGAILGKAMSALPEGQGMVLVLVTLQ